MRRRLLAVLGTAIVLSACGGSDSADDAGPRALEGSEAAARDGEGAVSGENGQSPTGSDGSSSANESAAAGGGGSTTTAPRATTDSTTSPTELTSGPATPLEVTLASACIKAGSTQTITIKAPEGSGVGYDSYYADGKSGISEGFYGGNNGAVMPASGEWSDTWVVNVHAPPGKVRVLVQALRLRNSVSKQELTFDLVPAFGNCG